jgi:hypothetical protein
MTLSRWLNTAVLAGGAGLLLGGCTVSAATPPLRVAYTAEYQTQYPPAYQPAYQRQPVYFDGLLVHYDSVGPYIFVGRTPRYIPRNHPRYREVARNDGRWDGRREGRHDGRREGRYDGRYDGRHDRRNRY